MVRVLFVGGLGRGGTTLLERILGELPGVCALGEVAHLWRHSLSLDGRCGCGQPFSQCPFWTEVGEVAFGGWRNVDVPRVLALREAVERTRQIPRLAAPRLPAQYQTLVTEYADYYSGIYRAAATVTGADVVVDSSRYSSLAYCLRWSAELDLRVVHLIGQGRGIEPSKQAAHHAAFALLSRRGVPVRRVHLDQLLTEPRAVLTDLAAFAGTATGDLDFLTASTARLTPGHSAAGDPMRFRVGLVPLRTPETSRRRGAAAGKPAGKPVGVEA